MMNSSKKMVIDELIEDVVAKLNFLSEKYGFHFLLNLFKKNELHGRPEVDKQFHNDGLSEEAINRFQLSNNDLQSNINKIMTTIASGKMVVLCTDAANIPEGYKGDWIVNRALYVVESVLYKKKGDKSVYYKLKGVKTPPNFDGFNALRFMNVCNENTVN